MSLPTLEQALRIQYDIDEPLFVEGNFLELIGNTKRAKHLVRMGIGKRFLAVANIGLCTSDIEYELMSIMPLSHLSINPRLDGLRLKVKSKFHTRQVFQLCTCGDQPAIWTKFNDVITKLGVVKKPNAIWVDIPLTDIVVDVHGGIRSDHDDCASIVASMLSDDEKSVRNHGLPRTMSQHTQTESDPPTDPTLPTRSKSWTLPACVANWKGHRERTQISLDNIMSGTHQEKTGFLETVASSYLIREAMKLGKGIKNFKRHANETHNNNNGATTDSHYDICPMPSFINDVTQPTTSAQMWKKLSRLFLCHQEPNDTISQ